MIETIPGTRVPDTAIHRASLWLEDLKFPDRRATEAEPMDEPTLVAFVEAMDGRFTLGQMKEAAGFYGVNMLQMTAQIPQEGFSARAVFVSLWMDAFMHGAATMAGKRGLSNAEKEAEHGA